MINLIIVVAKIIISTEPHLFSILYKSTVWILRANHCSKPTQQDAFRNFTIEFHTTRGLREWFLRRVQIRICDQNNSFVLPRGWAGMMAFPCSSGTIYWESLARWTWPAAVETPQAKQRDEGLSYELARHGSWNLHKYHHNFHLRTPYTASQYAVFNRTPHSWIGFIKSFLSEIHWRSGPWMSWKRRAKSFLASNTSSNHRVYKKKMTIRAEIRGHLNECCIACVNYERVRTSDLFINSLTLSLIGLGLRDLHTCHGLGWIFNIWVNDLLTSSHDIKTRRTGLCMWPWPTYLSGSSYSGYLIASPCVVKFAQSKQDGRS